MRNDHYERLDAAIQFIEKNLTNKITVRDVSGAAFSSLWHFQRIFRYITGYSIHSYIRRRRLSEAAGELILTGNRILDIALKFQYETPETFLREFKKVYGMTPSGYRKGIAHIAFEPIDIFQDRYRDVFNGSGITQETIVRKSISFIGKKFSTTMRGKKSETDIPEFWRKSYSDGLFQKIPGRIDEHSTHGVYINWDLEENFDLLVGSEVETQTSIPHGFEKHTIPPARYMVFTIPGNTSEKLILGWKYIYGAWFPDGSYEHGGADDFEVFDDRFLDPENPLSEIYISIR